MIDRRQVGGSTLSGVKAVAVSLDVFPWDESYPVSQDRLQERVEHTLRDLGIQVDAVDEDDPNAGQLSVVIFIERLIVGTGIEVYAVVVQVRHEETVCLCRNESVRRLAETWSTLPEPTVLRILPSDVLEERVDRILDEEVAKFVKAYRAANPQPHAQCSV